MRGRGERQTGKKISVDEGPRRDEEAAQKRRNRDERRCARATHDEVGHALTPHASCPRIPGAPAEARKRRAALEQSSRGGHTNEALDGARRPSTGAQPAILGHALGNGSSLRDTGAGLAACLARLIAAINPCRSLQPRFQTRLRPSVPSKKQANGSRN